MTAWHKVDKRDLEELKEHYLNYEPYCHLNIVDMWGWRVDPIQWFKIGDTAAYRLNDYNDDSPYLTVLGKHSAKRVIQELCSKNRKNKTIMLRCLPEETLRALAGWNAIIRSTEDKDNHDYIFEVKKMLDFSSPQLKNKRKLYRRFIKSYPDIKIRPLDHKKAADRRKIYKLFKEWVSQTEKNGHQKEFLALKRMLNMKTEKLVCLGFFDDRKIVGYTVNGPESNSYYQAFSGKANRDYKNLSLFMERETATYIHKHYGSRYINLQPDQGLEGLRNYKMALGPQRMLKKYTVVIDTAKALAG